MRKIHENAFIHESSYVDDNVQVPELRYGTSVMFFELSDRRGLLFGQNVVIGPNVSVGAESKYRIT